MNRKNATYQMLTQVANFATQNVTGFPNPPQRRKILAPIGYPDVIGRGKHHRLGRCRHPERLGQRKRRKKD